MTCSEWLRRYLGTRGSEHLCDTVREEAMKAGYTRSELKLARQTLGVKTFHQFDENGSTGNWFWYIPREGE